jgi:hypothetical protein
LIALAASRWEVLLIAQSVFFDTSIMTTDIRIKLSERLNGRSYKFFVQSSK